jgi:hypothetical protein
VISVYLDLIENVLIHAGGMPPHTADHKPQQTHMRLKTFGYTDTPAYV